MPIVVGNGLHGCLSDGKAAEHRLRGWTGEAWQHHAGGVGHGGLHITVGGRCLWKGVPCLRVWRLGEPGAGGHPAEIPAQFSVPPLAGVFVPSSLQCRSTGLTQLALKSIWVDWQQCMVVPRDAFGCCRFAHNYWAAAGVSLGFFIRSVLTLHCKTCEQIAAAPWKKQGCVPKHTIPMVFNILCKTSFYLELNICSRCGYSLPVSLRSCHCCPAPQ